MLPPGVHGADSMARVFAGTPVVLPDVSTDLHETVAAHHDFDAPDLSLIEELAKSTRRTSSPYLHELHEKMASEADADADNMGEVTSDLMTRVEGEKSAAEIRKLLEPYLHPTRHAQLQAEPAAPFVSQAKQRQLRTEHMKHVLEMKYAKLHARQRSAAEVQATLSKVTSVTNHTVAKSSEDDRSYRFITLSNGLRAVLVSDPNTTKSAAAMDVGNGYLSDPREIPGLAHFLEHMLFLGTKKYPQEAAYADFIESHGGFSNAYTAMENTNYYFDILPNHLLGALDRFAQFFIEPLLNVNTTEREMKAVDSEHSKNILSDNWRANRLLQDIANLTHPYSKFGTGCAQTLDVMPHEVMQGHLRKFWTEHYTANNLFLAVLGSESLDQLQAIVDEKFSAIRSSTKKYNPLEGTTYKDVWNSTILGSEVFVNTIEDTKWVSLIFPLESQYPKYRYQAVSYLRQFLESRAQNSLLKQLKTKGWATNVQFGIDAGTSAFATIQLSVELTLDGSSHIDEIVAGFFASLHTIRKKGIDQWRFEEMKLISNLTFTYKDKEQPSDYISKLASNVRHYPPEDMLIGGKIFLDFSKPEIEGVLKMLRPENMLMVIGGKNLNHDMKFKERWYGVEYDVVKIETKRMAYWKKSVQVSKKAFKFTLPPRSEFLPKNLTVNPPLLNPVAHPIILFETPSNVTDGAKRLWYSEDLEFHRPHGHAVFRMFVPTVYSTARNYLLTNIWVNLLEDQVDEELYSALVAGFSSHFRVGTCYVDLMFHGFNQGLIGYGQKIARIMNPSKGFKPNPERFKIYKETLLQSYLNKKYEAPHRQSSKLLSAMLDSRSISNYDLVKTLELIVFEDVLSWSKVLFNDMSLEAYVHGNVAPSVAKKLLKIFVAELPFKTTSAAFNNVPTRNHYIPRPRLGQVKEEVAVTMLAPNPKETNSAIVKYWQFGMGGIEGKLYSQLLALIGQKPIFHQLRTLEQLGYIVWSSADNRLDVNGFKIQVQSGRRPAYYLSERIDKFLATFQKTLLSMTQKQFEVYIETLMMSKLQSPVSMAVQTSWFWNEISKQEFVFQRKEIELYILNATKIINRAGFQDFVQKLFYISDADHPGVQSCELRGGGVLSVRIESPIDQVPIVNNATRKAGNGKKVVVPSVGVKKHIGGNTSGASQTGKKKKSITTSPAERQRQAKLAKLAAAKAQAKAKKLAQVASQLKAKAELVAARAEEQHKSLLAVDSETEVAGALDAAAESEDNSAAATDALMMGDAHSAGADHAFTEIDQDVDMEAEFGSDSESESNSEIDSEVDADADAESESESEVDTDSYADADVVTSVSFDTDMDESAFLEVDTELDHSPHASADATAHATDDHDHQHAPQQADTHYDLPHAVAPQGDVHGHAHGHVESHASGPAKRRAIIKGAGPFVAAGKDAKDVSISSLDGRIVVMTRARDGGIYVLNTTQSTLHVFTDSMMLYPRNRYEAPPEVTRWKNVAPPNNDNDAKTQNKNKNVPKQAGRKSKVANASIRAQAAKVANPAESSVKKALADIKSVTPPKKAVEQGKKKSNADRKRRHQAAKGKGKKGTINPQAA